MDRLCTAILQFFVLLTGCLVHDSSAIDNLRCREAAKISTNRVLLPLQSITALRPGSFSPLFRIVSSNDDERWCANTENSGPAVGNHINMSFTEPILIEAIVTRGHTVGDQPVFISSFSIFHQIGTVPLQQYEKVFTPSSIFNEPYLLRELIAATDLQFQINGAVTSAGDYYCWHLDIIGCRYSEAILVPVATSCPICPETPSSPDLPTPPDCPVCPDQPVLTPSPCIQPSNPAICPPCNDVTCPTVNCPNNPTCPQCPQLPDTSCSPCVLPPAPVCPNTITLYRYLRETHTEVQTETVTQSCSATASLALPPGQGVAVEGASQITLGVGTAMLAAGVIIITGSIIVVLFGIIVWSRRKKNNQTIASRTRTPNLHSVSPVSGTADGGNEIVWQPAVVTESPRSTPEHQTRTYTANGTTI